MSFGYYRTPSPAMQKARRLTNLRIDEVSSVDRGAGKGVEVKFMKRDVSRDVTQGSRKMETTAEIAKRNVDYARDEMAHARRLYPNDPHALAKWLASPDGQAVSSGFCRSNYAKLQHATALGDGLEEIEKRKGDGPKVRMAQHGTGDSSTPKENESFAQKVARLQKSGMSFDAAASQAIREG